MNDTNGWTNYSGANETNKRLIAKYLNREPTGYKMRLVETDDGSYLTLYTRFESE